MPRDSLFGEPVVWEGRPVVTDPPAFLRGLAGVAYALAAITLCFAAVIALALREFPAAPLAFVAWCVGLGALLVHLPRRWSRSARYVITETQVIVKYGPFSRSIERKAISYARIFWNSDLSNTGDLEVVRAVPTGALRRRLRLKLCGLQAPDRVWAIVRGAEKLAPAGPGERPVGQRLDHGERLVWTAQPHPGLSAYLPHGQREWFLLLVSGLLLFAVGRMVVRTLPVLDRLTATLPVQSFAFLALITGLGLSVLLMLTIAGTLAYEAVIRPGRLAKHTRYLVTNKRVLIQRQTEELHLDRDRIVDVIAAAAGDGRRNLFLVLDGPRARAVAANGAFGEMGRGPHLTPVFESVDDAEGVSEILLAKGELPEAA